MQRKMGLEGRNGDEAEPGRGRDWEWRSGITLRSEDEGMVWISCSPCTCGKENFIKRWKSEDRKTSEFNSPYPLKWAPLPVWELSPTNPARIFWENEGKWSGSLWMCQGMRRRRGRVSWSRAVGNPSLKDFIHVDMTFGDMGQWWPRGIGWARSQRVFPTFIIP